MDFASVEEPKEDITIQEASSERSEELHEAQLNMINSMTKVLDD
jgi:hypothetical protein